MTTAQKVKYGVILVGCICATVLLVTFLRPRASNDNKYFDLLFDLLMNEKEARRLDEQHRREETEKRYNDLLADSQRKDSLLAIKSTVNIKRYENVPSVVNSIPDNELRGAIIERYNLPPQ